MWEGLPRGAKFFAAFFPPDFVSRWAEIAEGIAESLWMTVISTVIGIALSIPVGIGAAKNIAPAPVYYFCRGILAVSRSFQEIILAIFFVKLFGFGPFAGVVTLSFATIGFYGKLLAEDIEDMDPAQAEAVRATGAGWLQWINYGVQPQVMPRMIGLGLYRFDINFRESAVVGIVGGGGIGATLNTAFDRYEFDSAAAILLIIIAIVMVVEYSLRLPAALGAVMATAVRDGTKVWQRRERGAQFAIWAAWLVGAAIFVYCWQLISDKTIWAFVTDAPAQAADLGVRMVPPDWGFIHELWQPIWDTLNIATLGTLMAIVIAMPIAYCAARNTTPSVGVRAADRAVHHRVVALDQLADLGADAGHHHRPRRVRRHPRPSRCARSASAPSCLYEAIEEIDESQVEAVRATGASGAQVTTYGIVPAGDAGLRRHFGVPLGHQHPRIDGAGPGRRRRHRPAAQRRDHHAGLDAGVADPAGDHRDRGGERMGVRQGAARDHLTARSSIRPSLRRGASTAPRRSCRAR